MPRDVGVVVVAAGQGRRVGGEVPKQFRPIGGIPMVLRALRPFTSHPEVRQVVLVLPALEAAEPPAWLAAVLGEGLRVTPGGAERAESVAAGLESLDPACAIVLVHDGARPFVEREVIDGVIAVARAGKGGIAAVPVSDTLKRSEDGRRVAATVSRNDLWRAQTPQGFPRPLLASALARAAREGVPGTDDAELVERAGGVVMLVPDTTRNLKVTTVEDLAVAEALAARP